MINRKKIALNHEPETDNTKHWIEIMIENAVEILAHEKNDEKLRKINKQQSIVNKARY